MTITNTMLFRKFQMKQDASQIKYEQIKVVNFTIDH